MGDVFMPSQWKTQQEASVSLLCMESALSEATTSRHADGCPDASSTSPVACWWRSHNFSMLSHEMLGLSVTKTEHGPSYLMQHTDRRVEHKSTQKLSTCRQLIFQHKVKLQSSKERMVLEQLHIHLGTCPYLTLHTEINSRWISNLTWKAIMYKAFRRKYGWIFHNSVIDFLNKKQPIMNEKIVKLCSIQFHKKKKSFV